MDPNQNIPGQPSNPNVTQPQNPVSQPVPQTVNGQPAYTSQQPNTFPPAPANNNGLRPVGFAVASLVLGIIGLITSFIFFLIFIGLTGLILGIIGIKSAHKKMAIVGIVLCSIAMILNVVFFFLEANAGLKNTANNNGTGSSTLAVSTPCYSFTLPPGFKVVANSLDQCDIQYNNSTNSQDTTATDILISPSLTNYTSLSSELSGEVSSYAGGYIADSTTKTTIDGMEAYKVVETSPQSPNRPMINYYVFSPTPHANLFLGGGANEAFEATFSFGQYPLTQGDNQIISSVINSFKW